MRKLAGKDEEVVGKAVHVFYQQGVHVALGGEVKDAPLGAAADGARDVAGGDGGRAAGQDEVTHGRQGGVHAVDGLLEEEDVLLADGDFRKGIPGFRCQIAPGIEKAALDFDKFVRCRGSTRQSAYHADVAVEFIHGPVGYQAGAILGHTLPPHEGGHALVACFRINFHGFSDI